MNIDSVVRGLSTLAHPGRIEAFRLLVRHAPQPMRPRDMAAVLKLKPNTLSNYLSDLETAGLVQGQRDGRAVLYRANTEAAGQLIDFLALDCCRGRAFSCTSGEGASAMTTQEPFNVLFICSGNSARSIFAEALLRDLGKGRFNAYSAGTKPHSELNPHALAMLERAGHATAGMEAKNISVFQRPDAPVMDFVFTVCDRAADETCQPWPGQPITAHWGVADPVKATGTEAEKGLAFSRAYRELRHRIIAFVELPITALQRQALQHRVDEIGADLGTRATS